MSAVPAMQPLSDTDVVLSAMLLANRAVIADIESECPAVDLADVRWRDTRPMLDPRERSPESVDMAQLAIAFGLDVHLLAQHPEQPHLVRVIR